MNRCSQQASIPKDHLCGRFWQCSYTIQWTALSDCSCDFLTVLYAIEWERYRMNAFLNGFETIKHRAERFWANACLCGFLTLSLREGLSQLMERTLFKRFSAVKFICYSMEISFEIRAQHMRHGLSARTKTSLIVAYGNGKHCLAWFKYCSVITDIKWPLQ